MSPTPPTPSGSSTARAKSTLFCPACDHESPVDGDWVVRPTETGNNLDCPACGNTVTVRPRSSADAALTCSLWSRALSRLSVDCPSFRLVGDRALRE